MVTLVMQMAFTGRSPEPVRHLPIFLTTSMPSVTLPKTGCCEGVEVSHQSRNLLCTVFTKNCEPPELGWEGGHDQRQKHEQRIRSEEH